MRKRDRPVVAAFAVGLVIAVMGALTAVVADLQLGLDSSYWASPTWIVPSSRLVDADCWTTKETRYKAS